MKLLVILIITVTSISHIFGQISADNLLKNSIQYHDSHGALMHHDVTLHLNEKIPNGTDRKSAIAFNISKDSYTNTRISKGAEIKSNLIKGKSTISVDGRSEYIFKNRITIEEMLQYKFHILIDGNDWCTSLPWVLFHNCVAFMPETTYESIFTIDLIPWKHYVPIRSDFMDIEEKIKYMIDNDNLAKEISYNSTLYMKQFTNKVLMDKIKLETIKRYCKNIKN
ncbi:MAG: glycosyl transferase family 90 [Saprospiraceae bacterium]|jgi:hypothetical protein